MICIESIRFKRTKDSEWENGLYIGDSDIGNKYNDYAIIDREFKPLPLNDEEKPECYAYESSESNSLYICTDDYI